MSQSSSEVQQDSASSEANDSPPPAPSTSISSNERRPIKQRRTVKACDRCRIKKSKCDGHSPCQNCSSSENKCTYSARRRRDVRNWECGMQDIMEEAVHRLYGACRSTNSFPGNMDSEHRDHVTTLDIFRGLGLATDPPPAGMAALGNNGGPTFVPSGISISSADKSHTRLRILAQNQGQQQYQLGITDRIGHANTSKSPTHTRNTSSHSSQVRESPSEQPNIGADPNLHGRRESNPSRNMCQQFQDFNNPAQNIGPSGRRPIAVGLHLQSQQHSSTTADEMRTISPTTSWHNTYPSQPMYPTPSLTFANYGYDHSWSPSSFNMTDPNDELLTHLQAHQTHQAQFQSQPQSQEPTLNDLHVVIPGYDGLGVGSSKLMPSMSQTDSIIPMSQNDLIMSESTEWGMTR